MKRVMSLAAILLLVCFSVALADDMLPVREARDYTGALPPRPADRSGSCTLTLARDAGVWAFFGWGSTIAGDGEHIKMWLDPATDQYGMEDVCTPPYYPFMITSFDVGFVVYDDLQMGGTMCFNVDIECPKDFGDGIPASLHGPGPVIYSQLVCHTVTEADTAGDGLFFVHVDLTEPVCVNGPFFAGVEFVSWNGQSLDPPSVLFDRSVWPPDPGDVWYYFNFANLLPCWYLSQWDFGCGANCAIGSWLFYVNGTSEAACTPSVCSPVVGTLPGETADNPILIDAAQWQRTFNLCDYASDYDQRAIWGDVLGSNTAPGGDIVLELRFPPELPEVCFQILIEPVCPNTTPPMNHFRIRSWLEDSFGPFDRGTPPFPGTQAIQYYDFTASGAGCLFNDVYRLYIDVRNCCCPVRVTYVGDQPLPVELTSFNAVAGDGQVTLNWTTASETNVARYEILRDNSVVASVPGLGDNPNGHTYTYVDRGLENGRTYTYRLTSYDINGSATAHGAVVSATPFSTVVTEYALYQNYPNPFNPSTTISYAVKDAGLVTLKVYTVDGREVTTLVNSVQKAGVHSVSFDASNLAAGVYLYKVEVNGFSATNKMVLLK